mmetsp:Transcript_30853/g.65197  ORF Transcript_30853/g.65197 Transcript_30853/m.65197 type:complete len:111 (-) Transcript_30853:2176-2508(-)
MSRLVLLFALQVAAEQASSSVRCHYGFTPTNSHKSCNNPLHCKTTIRTPSHIPTQQQQQQQLFILLQKTTTTDFGDGMVGGRGWSWVVGNISAHITLQISNTFGIGNRSE